MKLIPILVALSVVGLTGCGSDTNTASTNATPEPSTTSPTLKAVSYEKGSKKKGDKGVCAVCMIKEGKQTAEEEVKLVLDYKDKTYVFCNEAEEAEFISEPKKYAGE